MRREVLPEILDQLPADDPRARRSRRDLVRINWLMGNHRWLLARLGKLGAAGAQRMVELGAGDGTFCGKVKARLPGLSVTGVDLMPEPSGGLVDEWIEGDLFEAGLDLRGAVVVANLFLHHFEEDELAELGRLLSPARALLACEPERRALHQWQGRVLSPALGEVTRHDLEVSVGAGFRGWELIEALELGPGWSWRQGRNFFGAHRIEGERLV